MGDGSTFFWASIMMGKRKKEKGRNGKLGSSIYDGPQNAKTLEMFCIHDQNIIYYILGVNLLLFF